MAIEFQESATIRDYISLLRRRRAVIFGVFAMMSLLIVGGTAFLEDQYRSAAIIAIERPQIPESMVRTTVANYDSDLRIDRVTNIVLERDRVEDWIRRYDLYPTLRGDSLDEAVNEFREDVQVKTIQEDEDIATRDQGDTIAFEVAYFGQSADTAHQMAAVLANEYIDVNRRSRNQSVEETLAFFEREAQRLQQRIDDAEQRLADFKEENASIMPESSSVVVQMVERTERELETVQREIRGLRETRELLQGQLADTSPYTVIYSDDGETLLSDSDRLKLLESEYISLSSRYGPDHPDVVRARRELQVLRGSDGDRDVQTLRMELDSAKLELSSLRNRYSNDHPDVQNMERRVRALEDELEVLQTLAVPRSRTEPDNPEYLQLQVRIRATDEDLSALQSRERELRSKLREYDERMLTAPRVERDLLALTREYEEAIREYDDIRENQTEAQRARELEFSEKGERYVLQVPPREPYAPAFPNRIAIIVLGLIFSLGAGIGFAVIAEAIDSTVRSVRDLKTLTGMPPVVIVPVLETDKEHRSRVTAWTGSIVLVSGLLLTLIAVQLT